MVIEVRKKNTRHQRVGKSENGARQIWFFIFQWSGASGSMFIMTLDSDV
jgi:hypothetical protein